MRGEKCAEMCAWMAKNAIGMLRARRIFQKVTAGVSPVKQSVRQNEMGMFWRDLLFLRDGFLAILFQLFGTNLGSGEVFWHGSVELSDSLSDFLANGKMGFVC